MSEREQAVLKYLLDRYVPTGQVMIDVAELRETDSQFGLSQSTAGTELHLALYQRSDESHNS